MTKKIAVVAALLAVLSAVVWLSLPRRTKAQGGQSVLSRVGGVYNSKAYQYGAFILNGNSATGSQTITVCPAFVTLADGRVINPWSTSVPITIDPQSSVAETVTPTAVSVVTPTNAPLSGPCESITASFSNTHGASFSTSQVISGDQGIQEAINDASNNGGGMVYWEIDPGIVTLNTGGQSTNLGSINIPTRSTVMGATAKVTTTITGCSGGWSLGHTSGTELTAANTTLTAGTNTDSSTLNPAVAFNVAAKVPIAFCTTAAATAGAVHAKFWGYKMAAPAQ